MATRRARKGKTETPSTDGHPLTPTPEAPVKSNKSGHKTVIFSDDLEARVQAIANATRGSFTRAALSLIEKGLQAQDFSPAADLVRIGDLPTWMAVGIQEAGKASGLNPSGVVIDILTRHLREYLEQARAKQNEMVALLKLSDSSQN